MVNKDEWKNESILVKAGINNLAIYSIHICNYVHVFFFLYILKKVAGDWWSYRCRFSMATSFYWKHFVINSMHWKLANFWKVNKCSHSNDDRNLPSLIHISDWDLVPSYVLTCTELWFRKVKWKHGKMVSIEEKWPLNDADISKYFIRSPKYLFCMM